MIVDSFALLEVSGPFLLGRLNQCYLGPSGDSNAVHILQRQEYPLRDQHPT